MGQSPWPVRSISQPSDVSLTIAMKATKDINTVSAQVREQSTRYLGILNGKLYRLSTNLDSSEKTLELVPFALQPPGTIEDCEPDQTSHPPAANHEAALPAVAPPPAVALRRVARAEPIDDEARAEKKERAAKLFSREDSDPLPAGHPDLWNLLVAGTCLEGSTFRSA
jgi:hypothetical protein